MRSGLDAFAAIGSASGLAVAMLAAYLLGRRRWPRYAVPGVLVVGVCSPLARDACTSAASSGMAADAAGADRSRMQLSGVSLGGIGSAFRGVVGGGAALFVQQWRPSGHRKARRP